ncbi:hypothetical protein AMECASPLE_015971 [Ameca splendens]|uniref:Uncharacterized protein n=1 Tax=Ameca splendens TaxID=208324 RepID=A0ABV0XF69_9TELE
MPPSTPSWIQRCCYGDSKNSSSVQLVGVNTAQVLAAVILILTKLYDFHISSVTESTLWSYDSVLPIPWWENHVLVSSGFRRGNTHTHTHTHTCTHRLV